ncbi:NAD(P)/FAD-dependent oxidoreductase [Gorillibacterium timonense]|uniref:NAD(P)/FAD-dependent oxidoreductase n=1 Tax=Gorillibacterium timonense TaxID=1689269 RepID=UPI00071DD022|nr:FAD-dependent oxidoreductase [Gorillibacterium timonense]
MNLRTEKSNWLDTLPNPRSFPPLEEDLSCDVLIIGGGISGLLAARELMNRGIKPVLVDKRSVAGGSSSANTGLIQYSSDKSLVSCINTFGEEGGVRFYKLCQEGIGQLKAICDKLSLDPEFRLRDSLYYASCPEDVSSLQEEYEALSRFGFPVRYLDEADVASRYSFRKSAALLCQGDAEVNPFRITHALAQSAAENGMRIYELTEIRHHKADDTCIRLYTDRGKCITAQYALFAAGYETQEMKRNANAQIISSYAIATQPLDAFPGWPDRCLIWETARPYLYVRTTVDNRIVAGGMDEATADPEERDRQLPLKKKRLIAEVQKLFPELPPLRAEYGWAAAFGETHDGLPMIGEQLGFPRCYFTMGYGGNGSLYSLIAARINADLIEGKPNPDAALFRIDRPTKTPAMQKN